MARGTLSLRAAGGTVATALGTRTSLATELLRRELDLLGASLHRVHQRGGEVGLGPVVHGGLCLRDVVTVHPDCSGPPRRSRRRPDTPCAGSPRRPASPRASRSRAACRSPPLSSHWAWEARSVRRRTRPHRPSRRRSRPRSCLRATGTGGARGADYLLALKARLEQSWHDPITIGKGGQNPQKIPAKPAPAAFLLGRAAGLLDFCQVTSAEGRFGIPHDSRFAATSADEIRPCSEQSRARRAVPPRSTSPKLARALHETDQGADDAVKVFPGGM